MMYPRSNRGFTLVETLVAITVIMTAIAGPLYAMQQTLKMSQSSRDQLVASSLAQEGVEFVRAIRDNNYLYNNYLYVIGTGQERSWLFGIDGTDSSTNCITANCVVDPTQNVVSRTIEPLYLSTTGLYNQKATGAVTPFTRTVRITRIGGTMTEVSVVVQVSWESRGTAQNVTITDHLHDWL